MSAEKMNQFSYSQELANCLMSSDLLHKSWAAILDVSKQAHQNDPRLPLSVSYKRDDLKSPNLTVMAFGCSPFCTVHHLQGDGGNDLVSSETLKNNFPIFDFLSTKVNPSFSIHIDAIQQFVFLYGKLCEEKIDITKPLIITGHSLGGSVASLFTLWLLDTIYSKMSRVTKRPICITFGSPLLGDHGFQRAILERPVWTSCFIHVVSNQDPIPKFLTSPYNTFVCESNSQIRSSYKPFGSFLFCSESGLACFEEPESVLEVLGAMRSQNLECVDYGKVLEWLKDKAICRGSQNGRCSDNPFQTGIALQLQEIGVIGMQPQQDNDDLSIIMKIEENEKKFSARKANAFDRNKKLNERKINMVNLEWYKKDKETRDLGGYYDSYKYAQCRSRDEIRRKAAIVSNQKLLTQYWRNMVIKAERMPQREGAAFLLCWLMAGTNYRRMVEPLDIAEYYNQGKRYYKDIGRSEHYVLLEKWLDIYEKEYGNPSNQRNKACSLTEDSCFWAHVEEALISLRMLHNGERSEDDEDLLVKLVKFEEYVMDLISKHLVDPEIFLKESSFMKWWQEYDCRKGSLYESPLTNYMRKKGYKTYSNTVSASLYG